LKESPVHKLIKSLLLFPLLIQVTPGGVDQPIVLPSVFTDGMVLQQSSEVRFWGKANPCVEIIIKGSWGASARALAAKDGSWMAKIRTPKAGGPYQVSIHAGDAMIVYNDVLVGEVWLCSGQSNMELPLEGSLPFSPVLNSVEEIKRAQYPHIRVFTVGRNLSVRPEFSCAGEWRACDSSTAGKFSATAYFFGRKLFEQIRVPIGLIVSSWGGTPIEAWTSEKSLRKVGTCDSMLARLDTSRDKIIQQMDWIRSHPVIDISKRESNRRWQNLDFSDSGCWQSSYDDVRWGVMDLPVLWENTRLGNFDGAVWFRKKVTIPKNWVNRDLLLELGPIDDVDISYVNGVLVGKTEEEEQWRENRIYAVPKEAVRETILTIAVRVIDYGGGGGIYGDRMKMRIRTQDDTTGISLAGSWAFLPVAEYSYTKFYVYGARDEAFTSRPSSPLEASASTPTVLFDGMIEPLIPFGIKGVIWYQGESNTQEPQVYRKLFPLMIQDWRRSWNNPDLPFYFVQIAPFNYGPTVNSQILRESQMLTLTVPHTGMVVTMDIGERENIHPANKKDVGERLARWALARNYGKAIPFSGPLYKSMAVDGNRIILSFAFAEKGLVLNDDTSGTNFQIAGVDRQFFRADVRVIGTRLIVSSTEVLSPVAVRYAWSNTAQATLFNAEGLPASPFRTDDWSQ
jgi:sialate O-acetylesterase